MWSFILCLDVYFWTLCVSIHVECYKVRFRTRWKIVEQVEKAFFLCVWLSSQFRFRRKTPSLLCFKLLSLIKFTVPKLWCYRPIGCRWDLPWCTFFHSLCVYCMSVTLWLLCFSQHCLLQPSCRNRWLCFRFICVTGPNQCVLFHYLPLSLNELIVCGEHRSSYTWSDCLCLL